MREGELVSGRYRVLRRLGTGAMGAVYEVLDLDTERRRALKVMHAREDGRPDADERWRREARIAGHLDSPFIVDVLDVGVDAASGARFLVMELLSGEDLRQRLRRLGLLPAAEVALYLHQAALALDRMHRAGIVHRDLKPGNLFREEREGEAPRLKILDLGVAIESDAAHASVAGTPLYMAPEQLRGGSVGGAADVFALGMVAYTLLAGRAYWTEEWDRCRDALGFGLLAVRGPAELASARAARHGVALPAAFDAWFLRATAADPQRRFSSAGAAARELGRALGVELPAVAAATGGARLAGATADGAADPAATIDAAISTGAETAGMTASSAAEAAGMTASSAAEAAGMTASSDAEVAGMTASADAMSGARSGAMSGRTLTAAAALVEARAAPSRRSGGTLTAAASVIEASVAPATRAGDSRGAPARPPRWGRRLIAALGAIGGLAAGVALGVESRGTGRAVAPVPRSPLAAPASVLGCPIFEATADGASAGWLGAAAASLVCERARLVLGGAPARTRVPAELLALPRAPTDDFPADPYGAPSARARSLEAALRQTDAHFDGEVTQDAGGFSVKLVLWAGSVELARADGRGRALFEAVRQAMQPFVAQGLLPLASELLPDIREFSRARDPEAALDLLDLSLAMINNAGGLGEECARVAALGERVGELADGERYRCAYTLGQPLPEVRIPDGTATPGGAAARARIQHMVHRGDERQLAAEILRLLDGERSAWGRSVLAATASCLLQPSDPRRALELAWRAVQAEPKNPTGESCAPWGQLVAVTRGTTSASSVARAMQAWSPWDGYGWLLDTLGQSDGPTALAYAHRAYALSPLDANVAATLADKLLAGGGAADRVRSIARALDAGGYPVHHVASELLSLRADASEARFRAALDRARRAMQIDAGDARWVQAQRLDIAWRALEIAEILGRGAAAELADQIVEQFLDPEPPPLDGAYLEVPLRIPAICARASAAVAPRCFARFRALRDRLSGGILPQTEAFTAGAERYARGDLRGAAAAWRPLVKAPGVFATVMAEPMATAFERTGEPDLAERLVAAVPDTSAELNGASLGLVRAARRAAAHGQRDQARALAQRVIAAWSIADAPVPAVAELRRLLASLGDAIGESPGGGTSQ